MDLSITVLCDLCNKALDLLHVGHGWHGFCYCSNLIPKTEINTHRAHKDQYIYKHILTYTDTTCYVCTAATCITLNECRSYTKTCLKYFVRELQPAFLRHQTHDQTWPQFILKFLFLSSLLHSSPF